MKCENRSRAYYTIYRNLEILQFIRVKSLKLMGFLDFYHHRLSTATWHLKCAILYITQKLYRRRIQDFEISVRDNYWEHQICSRLLSILFNVTVFVTIIFANGLSLLKDTLPLLS